jgi:hypothetical protein
MAAGFKAIPTPKQGFVIQVRKGRVSALPALWKDSLGAQNCRRGINCYAARFLKTGAVKIELPSTVGGLKGQDLTVRMADGQACEVGELSLA